MRTYTKLLLAACAAALVLGTAVSAASARRFELSNQKYTVRWTSLDFAARDWFGSFHTIRCPVTLEGSFHSRTLSKVSGQLIGYVTRALVRGTNCTGGSATILNETLPWHVRHDRFIGALPNITGDSLQLINASVTVAFGLVCLYRSTAERPAVGIIDRNTTTGVAETLTADERAQIPLSEGEFGCPSEGGFLGTGEVFLTGTTTRITVRLVQ